MNENLGLNLIEVQDLKKYYPIKKGVLRRTVDHVKAVDGVTFDIKKGETLGLVGESGCGKSTLGRTLMNLYEKSGGEVFYGGTNIHDADKKKMNELRKEMQIIFQDPYSSLNPRLTVEQTIGEAVRFHKMKKKDELYDHVRETASRCGVDPDHLTRYPHEFSGGQRQRIGIARALALNPKFIVCDESVSALDVSVQAKVINLLKDLQKEEELTYLFITHDLSVVKHISDRIAVMYFGRIVELAETNKLFESPVHFYTKKLLSAIPKSHPRKNTKNYVSEKTPEWVKIPAGYKIDDRDPKKRDTESVMIEVRDGHFIACYKVD
ncbi:ATP-binding cassette domain-containing protein [Fusobacteria bacterium ZRK30]|nr:ATP-binding cassette domain-containing protein [Fusobacteria bacterium ZRK30]